MVVRNLTQEYLDSYFDPIVWFKRFKDPDRYSADSIKEMELYFAENPPHFVRRRRFTKQCAEIDLGICQIREIDPKESRSYENHFLVNSKDRYQWIEVKDSSAIRHMPLIIGEETYQRARRILDLGDNFRLIDSSRLLYVVPEDENQGNLAMLSFGKMRTPKKPRKSLSQIIKDLIPEVNFPVTSPQPYPVGV